jgi:hypothetical protein
MSERPQTEERRGEHNEIGYRNVDEEADYDERDSQSPEPEEVNEGSDPDE